MNQQIITDFLRDIALSENIPDMKFAEDIILGLSSQPKYLPSKYFYDAKGDKIFQQIMAMEEYYPTDCEFEILDRYKEEFLRLFSHQGEFFDLIEFGAGDGMKTKILLKHFNDRATDFKYLPIDISKNILNKLKADLQDNLPEIDVDVLCGDYFKCLSELNVIDQRRKVVLFLGSNIGNFTQQGTINFLKKIHDNLNPGDYLLIGFDLKKNPATILKAYNDQRGITASFNLNLLERINNEFDADFDLERFMHYPTYDPQTGEAKSYLISTKAQTVHVGLLSSVFHFEKWETIHTEISRKYDLTYIEELAEQCEFKLTKNFFDERKYYVNSLWMVE